MVSKPMAAFLPIPQSGVERCGTTSPAIVAPTPRQSSDASVQRNGSYALITTQQEALFSYRQGGSASSWTTCCSTTWP